jgi:hypothetical protein
MEASDGSDAEDSHPFDSAELENYDNDAEVLIRVMQKVEIGLADDKEYLNRDIAVVSVRSRISKTTRRSAVRNLMHLFVA